MKTFSAKPADVQRSWHIIDAKDQIVGKVAVEAARLLRGKHKAIFTPHIDTGDFVVIINAEHAKFSGSKEQHKIYARHSGYVGGQTIETPNKLRQRRPELARAAPGGEAAVEKPHRTGISNEKRNQGHFLVWDFSK